MVNFDQLYSFNIQKILMKLFVKVQCKKPKQKEKRRRRKYTPFCQDNYIGFSTKYFSLRCQGTTQLFLNSKHSLSFILSVNLRLLLSLLCIVTNLLTQCLLNKVNIVTALLCSLPYSVLLSLLTSTQIFYTIFNKNKKNRWIHLVFFDTLHICMYVCMDACIYVCIQYACALNKSRFAFNGFLQYIM